MSQFNLTGEEAGALQVYTGYHIKQSTNPVVLNSSSSKESKEKLARSALIKNPPNIMAKNIVVSNNCIIRADLSLIKMESYSILCDGVILCPPLGKNGQHMSLNVGKYVIIGPQSIIRSNDIGACARIGRNCILENNTSIGSNSIIEDDSVVPEDNQIPSGCVYGGKPAVFKRFVPPSTSVDHMLEAINLYHSL